MAASISGCRAASEVDWTKFQTAYGRADDVPAELVRLVSTDRSIAMDATHKLWYGLRHQHAYISDAALLDQKLKAFPTRA